MSMGILSTTEPYDSYNVHMRWIEAHDVEGSKGVKCAVIGVYSRKETIIPGSSTGLPGRLISNPAGSTRKIATIEITYKKNKPTAVNYGLGAYNSSSIKFIRDYASGSASINTLQDIALAVWQAYSNDKTTDELLDAVRATSKISSVLPYIPLFEIPVDGLKQMIKENKTVTFEYNGTEAKL